MVFFLLLFLRKRLIHFLCMWLVTLMLFVPVGKRSKSRSQMFCKIENLFISLKMLLKILQYSQENICVLEFLFNQLYLKNAATQVFSCEYCKMFKYSFFYRTPAFHNVFRNSYVMIEFFGSLWVQNCCHISCAIAFSSFMTLVLESEVHCHFLYILFLNQNF